VQAGSFGTVVNNDYVTGPTTLPGLSYRVDGTFSHSDGFRDLASHDYEVLPQLQYKWAGHTTNVAVDIRQIKETPDSYGIIYFNGSPLKELCRLRPDDLPNHFSPNTQIAPDRLDRHLSRKIRQTNFGDRRHNQHLELGPLEIRSLCGPLSRGPD
jgi:iron complex outermembrane receptor protein